MALQSYTLAVGNLQDDNNGNNYAVNKPVYILKQDRTLQPIFSDLGGTSPIIQDGVNNATNERGEFSFYVESGDYIASVGGIDRAFTVVGSDYFDNKVDDAVDLFIESVAGRGAYYVVGSFEAGFTYTDINQTGTYNNGGTLEYYVYTGGIANLPHAVTAGTNPTTDSNYARVNYNQSSQVVNDDGSTVQEFVNSNLTPFKTVAEMKVFDYTGVPEFTRIEWQGYYAQSDGGGNWCTLRFGAHTEDGGSVFSIDSNTYIEANIKAPVSVKKFGATGNGVDDDFSSISKAYQASKSLKFPDGKYKISSTLILDKSYTEIDFSEK